MKICTYAWRRAMADRAGLGQWPSALAPQQTTSLGLSTRTIVQACSLDWARALNVLWWHEAWLT